MKIQVAGPGCGRCQATEKVVHEICKSMDLKADIEHVYNIKDYSQLGVTLTPAVLVEGKIIFAGRVPSNDELENAIKEVI